jgi:osmotically inducible protein OsmC
MKRKANALWKGSGKEGSGVLTTTSGVLNDTPYSFSARFENEDGKAGTNPEELIGAAHAGCFAMALSFALGKEGHTPNSLDVKAVVTLSKTEGGFAISKIDLHLEASVDDISEDKFMEIAKGAKENCPVSQALSAVDIELHSKLN